jgi:hypothetical protein
MANAAVASVAIVGVIVKMELAAMVAGRATVDVQDLVGMKLPFEVVTT